MKSVTTARELTKWPKWYLSPSSCSLDFWLLRKCSPQCEKWIQQTIQPTSHWQHQIKACVWDKRPQQSKIKIQALRSVKNGRYWSFTKRKTSFDEAWRSSFHHPSIEKRKILQEDRLDYPKGFQFSSWYQSHRPWDEIAFSLFFPMLFSTRYQRVNVTLLSRNQKNQGTGDTRTSSEGGRRSVLRIYGRFMAKIRRKLERLKSWSANLRGRKVRELLRTTVRILEELNKQKSSSWVDFEFQLITLTSCWLIDLTSYLSALQYFDYLENDPVWLNLEDDPKHL